jgi:Fe-S cluster biosynthesis and repair protein YggX
LVDTVFEELVSDKSFIETCNFLRSHAIRLDQQYKKKAARQIHNTSQLSNRAKEDKIKKVLLLINEIKLQDSCSSDKESITLPPTNTAMVCKLAQIAPEIWITLPLEGKKWLLNERKRQQQEDET